jgi:hypothetical protein
MTALCALSFSTLLLSGCAHVAAYRLPITRFQQASTVVIEATRTQYTIANRSERDAEIDRLVARQERIDLKILDSVEVRLFGPDDLVARMDALDALAAHGELLLMLASADAPTEAGDAARSLNGSLAALVSSLARVESDRFSASAGAFATIAAEVTKMVMEGDIERALDKAIIAAEQNVIPLLRMLREEMAMLCQRRGTGLSDARVAATDAYNEELDKPTPSTDKLRTAATRIKRAEDTWCALPALLGTGPGLDAMAEAHGELVDYAKSSKTPQDLADLVEATDAFVMRATAIADAMKAILPAKE